MTAKKDIFHRQELARLYAEDALDTSLGMSGGLFLAAPRRTGKSTFVRQDLVPALEAQGARVIYIDLWADKTKKVELAMTSAKLELMQTVASMPPLQVGLLEELAKITQQNTLNPNVNPHQGLFSQQMFEKIKTNLMNKGLKDNSANIETSAIQNGLDNLREKNFLWRSQRGAYWLEDEQIYYGSHNPTLAIKLCF